jgi:hypothetical protein
MLGIIVEKAWSTGSEVTVKVRLMCSGRDWWLFLDA